MITSKKGTLTIDAYTEPGASPNTATVLTNAVVGVELRGNGSGAHETALRITSFSNTIRGFAINNFWRGIVVDGVNAHDNQILGNWVGFTGNGSSGSGADKGVLLNNGATYNHIGTPNLADRNFVGAVTKGIDHFSPGTDYNVIQNNVFCIRPNGGTATCATGVDHDFGPKNNLIGGTGANEKNVFGPTSLQGVEYSHGWNPAYAPRVDDSITWQVDGNRLIGNWIGFRGDGSYSSSYRSGLTGGGDNGNAVNVYDSTNFNIVRGNWIGTAKDGVQVMAPDAQHNEVRDNIIGVSPLGEPAPMSGWGVRLRWGARYEIVAGNTIRNAASGGIGLTRTRSTTSPSARTSSATRTDRPSTWRPIRPTPARARTSCSRVRRSPTPPPPR